MGVIGDRSDKPWAVERICPSLATDHGSLNCFLFGLHALTRSGTVRWMLRANNRQVILNPGTIPDKGLAVPNADITVAFEQSYNHYKTNQESALKSLDEDRDSLAYIFHSVPDMSEGGLKSFVDDISHRAAYLYLTTRTDQYYEHFDSQLEQFCDAVPT